MKEQPVVGLPGPCPWDAAWRLASLESCHLLAAALLPVLLPRELLLFKGSSRRQPSRPSPTTVYLPRVLIPKSEFYRSRQSQEREACGEAEDTRPGSSPQYCLESYQVFKKS